MPNDSSTPPPHPLGYETAAGDARRSGSGIAPVFTSLCVILPAIGFTFGIGPVFLLGLPLSIAGVVVSTIAMKRASPAASAWLLFTLLLNGLSLAYFYWLFFVRGLC